MNEMAHLKSMVFQKQILKVAIICTLATIWLISFGESARLVREGHSEQRAVLAVAAQGARVLDTGAVSEGVFRAFQGNAGIPHQRSLLFGAGSKLATALALVAMGVPLGLSTLSILFIHGAPARLVPRPLGIPFRFRLSEQAAVWRGNSLLQRESKL